MGVRLIVEVLDCYHGPARQKLWLIGLAEHANDGTRRATKMPRGLLASRAGVSESRASHIATALAAEGVIKRVGGGGKNRGPKIFELLAMVHSQGAPRAHSDSESQDAELAHPDGRSQGAFSEPQGAESHSQGAASSPPPAETPGLNPSVKTPLNKTPLNGQKAGPPDGSRGKPRERQRPSEAKIIRDVRAAITLVYGEAENSVTDDEVARDLWGYYIGPRWATITNPVVYLEKIFNDTPDLYTLTLAAVGSEQAAEGLAAAGLGEYAQGEGRCRDCGEPVSNCVGHGCCIICEHPFTAETPVDHVSGFCVWCDKMTEPDSGVPRSRPRP
jgi:hypothetical protein